jgi:hypothetical protein
VVYNVGTLALHKTLSSVATPERIHREAVRCLAHVAGTEPTRPKAHTHAHTLSSIGTRVRK